MKNHIQTIIYYTIAILVYGGILFYGMDFCYFFNNVQQIATDALWFYGDGTESFTTSLPPIAEDYPYSGYHMPTIGFTTALMWKIFGCHVWVSHLYSFFWALVFIIAVKIIVDKAFSEPYSTIIGLILIFEPCVLSQYIVASSDFIMLTTFALAFCAIGTQRPWLFSVALLLLSIHSLRGIFMGICMLLPALYYYGSRSEKGYGESVIIIFRTAIPAFIVSCIYYTYYFLTYDFVPPVDGEILPSPHSILEQFKTLFISVMSGGRISIILLTAIVVWYAKWRQTELTLFEHTMGFFSQSFIIIYIILAIFTNIEIDVRFFMPLIFALTFYTMSFVMRWLYKRSAIIIISIVILSEIYGLLFTEINPCTLDGNIRHVGYYNVREQVLDYIEQNNIKGTNVKAYAGFNRNPVNVSLESNRPFLNGQDNAEYLLYSNISSIDSTKIQEINNPLLWNIQKTFKSDIVEATLYRRVK